MRRTIPAIAAGLVVLLLALFLHRSPPPPLDGTTILVLRARPGSLELVSSAAKPFACAPQSSGDLRFTVEDDHGALLAEGAVPAPPLCGCGGADHVQGCVSIRHEAVVRVKVPHRAARERVSFRDGRGDALGSFTIESAP